MRYLVKTRVKPGREKALLGAIDDGSLGRGSIAGDEYVYDMIDVALPQLGDEGGEVQARSCAGVWHASLSPDRMWLSQTSEELKTSHAASERKQKND
jgi:hypothetical protein